MIKLALIQTINLLATSTQRNRLLVEDCLHVPVFNSDEHEFLVKAMAAMNEFEASLQNLIHQAEAHNAKA